MSFKILRFSLFITNLVIVIFGPSKIWADYPQILSLTKRDILYQQLQNDIALFYKIKASNKNEELPKLLIFNYNLKPNDTLFSIAAQLNLPYDTLASLNRISQTSEFNKLSKILVPNLPGIFVPVKTQNNFEEMAFSIREVYLKEALVITIFNNKSDLKYYFFPGDKFHPLERAYFFKILYKPPLAKVMVTSPFGYRSDPFSGKASFHSGMDLFAPVGSAVYAVREGVIKECGYNENYGKYIIIEHPDGYQSVYGHLNEIFVQKGQNVFAGIKIATVGLTGKTTGPHLHFEIRKNGQTLDPHNFLISK